MDRDIGSTFSGPTRLSESSLAALCMRDNIAACSLGAVLWWDWGVTCQDAPQKDWKSQNYWGVATVGNTVFIHTG